MLGGTPVPLPSQQNLSPDITPNAANTVFTIGPAGRYFITFNIRLTAALLLGARLVVNGSPVPQATINAVLSTTLFSSNVILTLPANSTVSVQLFGLLGTATLQSGSGASLTMIRLQ
ncbi:BclA C-terminal domain-containing protein [Evansella halocellulosilytica]|uniref:BclA C-terminal domain-containing protein n=1 Tax=Evansella halocellulosilytica TaxID=2011013 RepID=UPI00211B83B7|nr:hypothetical protein [Evansella halocellulosilytica]